MSIKFREGIDAEKALEEVDRAIDTLQDLPDESEEITTQLLEPRMPSIRVAVYGDLDEAVLKNVARGVRDDLLTSPIPGRVSRSSRTPRATTCSPCRGWARC